MLKSKNKKSENQQSMTITFSCKETHKIHNAVLIRS